MSWPCLTSSPSWYAILSRKPDTRATMLTWRELSVCATNVGENGMVFGAIVSTATCGAGRGGGGRFLAAAGEDDGCAGQGGRRDAQRSRARDGRWLHVSNLCG